MPALLCRQTALFMMIMCYIYSQSSKQDITPGVERFRHPAKKMKTEASLMSGVDKAKTAFSAQSDVKIIQNQLEQYVAEVQQSRSHADQNPLKFWVNH